MYWIIAPGSIVDRSTRTINLSFTVSIYLYIPVRYNTGIEPCRLTASSGGISDVQSFGSSPEIPLYNYSNNNIWDITQHMHCVHYIQINQYQFERALHKCFEYTVYLFDNHWKLNEICTRRSVALLVRRYKFALLHWMLVLNSAPSGCHLINIVLKWVYWGVSYPESSTQRS